ncbi:hypothetical protein HBDW_41150 [Herbaspirillum sp. DW155]|uniref:hypothetical protein n=1 Tax=Herbaspirillum sp. DW155 TaxID=3095609 RepID=UPI003084E538|nr:hypothetical protein HBDW_41150 [Herbaspirillum sp. DW155]
MNGGALQCCQRLKNARAMNAQMRVMIGKLPVGAMLVVLTGYDGFSSEPTYSGLSLEAFNYTPSTWTAL